MDTPSPTDDQFQPLNFDHLFADTDISAFSAGDHIHHQPIHYPVGAGNPPAPATIATPQNEDISDPDIAIPTQSLPVNPAVSRQSLPLPARPELALAHLITANPAAFETAFMSQLAEMAPLLRQMFPAQPRKLLAHFSRAMDYILSSTAYAAGDPQKIAEVIKFAHQLGADHRKLRIGRKDFSVFSLCLSSALRELAGTRWTERHQHTIDTVTEVIADAMLEGAHAASGPATVGATVVEVLRPLRDTAVIRLLTDEQIPYDPGQYLSVQTPFLPHGWRHFSSAIPSNSNNQIEFHVRAIEGGECSPMIARHTAVGDRWVLAHPLGEFTIERGASSGSDVLMIAGGTGIAPMRAILLDMCRFTDNPRVHLFYGANFPGELHDLETLVSIAVNNPWLTIQPVVDSLEHPWWLKDAMAEPPALLHSYQVGTLVEVVTSYGSWSDRQVLVCGNPEMVHNTVRGLLDAGTPRAHIQFDPLY